MLSPPLRPVIQSPPPRSIMQSPTPRSVLSELTDEETRGSFTGGRKDDSSNNSFEPQDRNRLPGDMQVFPMSIYIPGNSIIFLYCVTDCPV